MKLVWSTNAWGDYLHWQATDPDTLARLNELIKVCMRTPFKGIGKVEPLKGNLKGWWSRRITGAHRLVYRVSGAGEDQALEIAQCRWHYDH
ncbi:Txe/YoeB family addiction module toxin [Methylobacterium sp. J-077]|uniref:Txe/YoeB family addiction module toxin n=1 Tax=Methylobacterium sp. J-077 TaxID=2836656 RepID=UPI001FBAFE34|nr:Txe/YoeB family addiction module toxin [Methylobacterium sp. J-077]MCJ2121598.1 Txe/YoeB family addiction module toxin [Methylobacterium sp. J-077]